MTLGKISLFTEGHSKSHCYLKKLQVYDPCMGSGSLMLSRRNYSSEPDYIKYYGQELMLSNMFYNTSIPTCIVVLKKHRSALQWRITVDL